MFAPFFGIFLRRTPRTWISLVLSTLHGNLFPFLGKLTDCCLAPDYQEFSCGLFYTPPIKAEKLTSCAQPQSSLTSSEARESARCPRVPDCSLPISCFICPSPSFQNICAAKMRSMPLVPELMPAFIFLVDIFSDSY